MGSSKQQIIAALDAAEASYRELAALPLEALTRPEKTQLLKRLGDIDKKMAALDRRLIGQLISQGDPAMFGARSWAEVLSRRLRISPGEAQQRIAAAANRSSA
ncbi:DUF222 domain-containing protein [Mycobacterium sp. NPDC048908]|uniref:DUF222 domain-containing protein n=1 Tax=Mycobacterium sp. NPDC048908 TaxID=3364292 RepID=UPI00371669C0